MKINTGKSHRDPITIPVYTDTQFGATSSDVSTEISNCLNTMFGGPDSYQIMSTNPGFSPIGTRDKFYIVRLRDKDRETHTFFFRLGIKDPFQKRPPIELPVADPSTDDDTASQLSTSTSVGAPPSIDLESDSVNTDRMNDLMTRRFIDQDDNDDDDELEPNDYTKILEINSEPPPIVLPETPVDLPPLTPEKKRGRPAGSKNRKTAKKTKK